MLQVDCLMTNNIHESIMYIFRQSKGEGVVDPPHRRQNPLLLSIVFAYLQIRLRKILCKILKRRIIDFEWIHLKQIVYKISKTVALSILKYFHLNKELILCLIYYFLQNHFKWFIFQILNCL